ncbi:hypothetical protein IE81DRAFT_95581 [Ceraceosorus guamensis]|uniref:Uncharacterized protein n=1 Tax=Ceraceosorus guamensis TaxID=1522189 RepID=A0A316W1D5_9BASI|nr:hypothetical protein IE81DRAFT_95581 [Ceraceosorus guamensis]PWN43314.1 hypothetical protein IE81DRAFT_95581 [Ceraceosorus guamensis]
MPTYSHRTSIAHLTSSNSLPRAHAARNRRRRFATHLFQLPLTLSHKRRILASFAIGHQLSVIPPAAALLVSVLQSQAFYPSSTPDVGFCDLSTILPPRLPFQTPPGYCHLSNWRDWRKPLSLSSLGCAHPFRRREYLSMFQLRRVSLLCRYAL